MSDKTAEGGPRVIKRYSNRKLYDTQDSRYVTLQQIGEMVRDGEDVRIIDNKTKEDKTEATLALILSEDLKNKPRSVPLGTLRNLLQERGERILSQLRDGPIGRLIPSEEESSETADPPVADESEGQDVPDKAPERPRSKARLGDFVESSKHTLDQLQASLDDRVKKALVPGLGMIQELSGTVDALTQRVEALEAKLARLEPSDSD